TVLQNIVSGLGGRYFEAIREKQGLAYTVQTSNVFYAKSGAMFTYTAFSPDNESKVREALQKEVERVRKDGVTKAEVDQAIAYSIGTRAIAMQSRVGQVMEYARALNSGAGLRSVENYETLVKAVTPEQIKTIAGLYLDPQSLRVAVVRGKK